MSGIWAAVPMKEVAGSKQRLAGVLRPAQRMQLALAMFEDVLEVLHQSPSLAGIAVVTLDPDVARIAVSYGAQIIVEDARAGHTAAVNSAGRVLRTAGCTGMLAVPGDIPLVTTAEIETLLATHGSGAGFTIVPSHDEFGSNAVVASPPGAVPLRFGDDSYRPHLAAAQAAGLPYRSLHLRGVALDIDHPCDLDAFLADDRDSRTRRWLLASDYRGDGKWTANSIPSGDSAQS